MEICELLKWRYVTYHYELTLKIQLTDRKSSEQEEPPSESFCVHHSLSSFDFFVLYQFAVTTSVAMSLTNKSL